MLISIFKIKWTPHLIHWQMPKVGKRRKRPFEYAPGERGGGGGGGALNPKLGIDCETD